MQKSNKKMKKTQLELITSDNGVTFLNFWDSNHGNDVCCEVVEDYLLLSEINQFGQDVETKITLSQFIDKVKQSIE